LCIEKIQESPLEKEIVKMFVSNYLDKMKKILNIKEIRVYSFEFPVEYEDQKGSIDLILEDVIDGNIFNRKNPLLVIEFKKDKIKYGPVDQLNFYMKTVGKQLYRPNVTGFLAAPAFSYYELEEAKKNNFRCIQFDLRGNMQII